MTFVEHGYSRKQIAAFRTNAANDLARALRYGDPDVSFRFAYDALVKIAVAVCASRGKRVLSRTGHHAELLEKLSEIMKHGRIRITGDEMRKTRNRDMYAGGMAVTEKAAAQYLRFVKDVFALADEYFARIDGKRKMI